MTIVSRRQFPASTSTAGLPGVAPPLLLASAPACVRHARALAGECRRVRPRRHGERYGALLAGVLVLVLLAAGMLPARAQSVSLDWAEPIEVAHGPAHRGPWRMNDSQFLFVDDPGVAVNDAGVTAVVYVDNARKEVLLQIYEPDGRARLAEPVNVSRSPRIFSWLPRVLVSPGAGDAVHVLWQEIVFSGGSHGGESFFARSRDGGRTFDPALNLSNSTAGDGKGRLTFRHWDNGSLDLARAANGDLFAAWTEYEGRLWLSRSQDGGASFSAPLHVAGDDARPARGPSLAVTADGTLHLAWALGEDPQADIHLARSRDGGRSFAAPRTPFRGDAHDDAPALAVGVDGALHLAFARGAAGAFTDHRIMYARAAGADSDFDTPRQLSAAGSPGPAGAHYPSLGLDAHGRVYVIWELLDTARARPHALELAVSADRGASFAPAAPVPHIAGATLGTSGSQQGLLMRKLAVAASGRVAIVNSTFRAGERSTVWLLQGTERGP